MFLRREIITTHSQEDARPSSGSIYHSQPRRSKGDVPLVFHRPQVVCFY